MAAHRHDGRPGFPWWNVTSEATGRRANRRLASIAHQAPGSESGGALVV
jgi:hypothetical protein